MRRVVLFFATLFLVFSAAETGIAQETTAEIQGFVSDGSVGLAGATVVATHTPTGTVYTTTSRKDGRYNFANVRVGGPYEIKVTYAGFKEDKQTGINLNLGQTYSADFILKTSGDLTEVVITTGRQNKVINNNRTGSQEIINRTQMERLPTINRSLADFTKLEPTAQSNSFGQSFGGRSGQYNNLTVDGANFNNSFGLSGTLGGQTGSQPISLDAIEQIQVNVSPYDVRQGGFTGAGLNTVTRSGTNQFRGTAYMYTKNENTQGYKVANTTVVKSPIKFKLMGAALGGPIIKNKLFFFGSYEQVRQELPVTSFIASDASHAPTAGSVSIANADTLAQLSKFLSDKFQYNTGAFQGYNQKTQSDKITVKIDWNISKQHTLSLKYNYLKSSADQNASTSRNGYSGFIAGSAPGNTSMPFQNSGYTINNNFNIFIAELNSRFSNKIVNKFQIGYTALRDFRTPQGNSNMPLVDILLNGNNYTTFGYEPFTYNNKLNTNNFQFSDIFTVYQGSHELNFGTQNYFKSYLNGFAPAYQGLYQFNSLQDFYNSVNNGTSATRYALQYSALKDGSFPYAKAGSTDWSVFVQDKWRVSKTFTLTYGVRADGSVYTGTFDKNPDFAALTFANGAHYDVGKKPKAALLISPRIGFNWDALGDKSLQVRGGGGYFSGPPPFVWISNQASNNGVQFGSLIQTTGVPFNTDPNAYRPTSGAANTSYGIAVVASDFKYPSVIKTSLAVDKKLPGDWIVTLEGSYAKDINAVYYSNVNLNQSTANSIVLNQKDNRVRYAATTGSNRAIYSGAGGASAANPNISSAILMSNTNKGYSYTGTFRIQKTFKDLYLSAAYTYAKSKNTAEPGSTAGGLWSSRPVSGDPNADNLTYASWYQPHRVVAFASYKISYAKYFATSIGLYFEAAPNGVTSYVYNGDVNNDGNNANDLIYIPANASEINLVKSNSGGLGTGTTNVVDTRTAAQQWAQLNAFINQDNYLSTRRGKTAEANAVVNPYFKKLDLNITEDISFKTGAERHTLRLSLDILNVGNLLNKYWGLAKSPSLSNFLRYEGLAADGKTPSYSFTQQDPANQVPYVNSTSYNTSIFSRWQMQFGIRYLFN